MSSAFRRYRRDAPSAWMRHRLCVGSENANYKRQTLRILLADEEMERVGAVTRVLALDAALTVLRIRPGQSLVEAVADLAPDVVLVDMARPDRDALDGIRRVSTDTPRPVVLFIDEDDPDFMEEAINAGVSSYNAVGLPPPDVKPILRAAVALFRRHQQATTELRQAENRLLERGIVDRAKATLIRQRRVSEPEAYGWLRKTAMSRGRRIVDIARDVLANAGEPVQ
jgi:two-component system, response regulator / RNA-binding antiterminator